MQYEYICATCGMKQQNNQTGFCINDHDDWLSYSEINYMVSRNDSAPHYSLKTIREQINRLKKACFKFYKRTPTDTELLDIFS